ncbi:MAG: hypothetical protein QM718_14680 [Steroidobacteraceae bacterium]
MKNVIASRLAAAICAVLAGAVQAQIKEIPQDSNGIEGLTKSDIAFEPENEYRRTHALGESAHAAAGTPPGSTDPHNLSGSWIVGPIYSVNADGTYDDTEKPPGQSGGPGAAPGGAAPPGVTAAGAAPSGGPPQGGAGAPAGFPSGPGKTTCIPVTAFTLGMPGRILQADNVIYLFENGPRTMNRRIEMNGSHPDGLVPTYSGHSIAHWEGEWLIVDTVGLKGSPGLEMGGGGLQFTSASRVTERLRKFDDNMMLESFVTVTDPALKQPIVRRVTAYYRPDLNYVEAPCEEYSDPFEGQYNSAPAQRKP